MPQSERARISALACEIARLRAWLRDHEERLSGLELDDDIQGPLSPEDEDTLPVIRLSRRKRQG